MIMDAPGSLSEGFTTSVLPVTVASAADHSTILRDVSTKLRFLVHPHGRKIERGDACADTKWYPAGICVHIIGDLQLVTEEIRCDSCGGFDNLGGSTELSTAAHGTENIPEDHVVRLPGHRQMSFPVQVR